jgi:hypothetical protein
MSGYFKVDWDKAACKDFPVSLFYAIEGARVQEYVKADTVRNICLACPIIAECLKYAFANETYGLWGGMVSYERAIFLENNGPLVEEEVIMEFEKAGIDAQVIWDALPKKEDIL